MNTRHEALVKLLILRDDVNVDINTTGQTPLSWAAREGQEAVVKLLLDTGKVDVDLKNEYGRIPLSWAIVERPGNSRLHAKAGVQIKVLFKSEVLRLVGYAAYILPNVGRLIQPTVIAY